MMKDIERFKAEVRLSRGKLTRHDVDLEDIFIFGSKELCAFTLTKKRLGIKNIHWLAMQDYAYQKSFTDWADTIDWKAPKRELDLWFSQNKGN